MRCVITIVLLASVLICSSFTESLAGSEDIAGVIVERSSLNSEDVRTVTFDPSVSNARSMLPLYRNALPHRDEGEGEVLWSDLDESAISENVALSADGEWVALGFHLNDERFEMRWVGNGEPIFTFRVADGPSKVAISADGSIAAFAALDSVWVFEQDNFEFGVLLEFGMQGYRPGPVAVSRDGRYLVATGVDPGGENNRVFCFERRNDDYELSWTFECDAQESYGWYGATISMDSRIVAVNGKYHLYVIDRETGDLIWDAPTYNAESAVALSADAGILVFGSLSGHLWVFMWDEENETYRDLWHYSFQGDRSNWVTSTAISADGTTIAAGTLDFFIDHYEGRVVLFDTYGPGEPRWTAEPLADMVDDVAVSLNGQIIAAVTWGDLQHFGPDLLIFEKYSNEPFYELVTPGSLGDVAMSDDGTKVIAGGKAVHNRQMGRGGRIYMVESTFPGGYISGTVTDEDDRPMSDVEVIVEDNPYVGISNDDGHYRLLVEAPNRRVVTVETRRRGYTNSEREDVQVEPDEETANINFSLTEADPPPRELRASQGERDAIVLTWEPYNNRVQANHYSGYPSVLAATGETPPELSIIPWTVPSPPRRDDADEAENINIYRSHQPWGPYYLVGSTDGDADSYIDRHLVFPQRTYYYVITADFGNGESVFSEEATAWLADEFLVWDADLEDMPRAPRLDGVLEDDEWEGAVERDISDVFAYDGVDTSESVTVLIGFDDNSNQLFLGFNYSVIEELEDRMGVGVYVDDDGNGRWTLERPGSEGNYWGYWIDGEPDMRYRSLSLGQYRADPYYQFDDPPLAFSDQGGNVIIEMAIPLGFHELWETALYAPDYEIGLGLFAMHRADDDSPIFNGWWPQNMVSIVSNPEQFARIRIPADLIVPPAAPTDVAVVRDEDRLVVTWADPILGIDGGELEGLTGINLYRNGQPTEIFDIDIERYVDDQVAIGGWYEYSVSGFVMDNGEPFEGFLSEPVGVYAVESPEISQITYDDGSSEGNYVVSFVGEDNRFGVRFDLDMPDDTVMVYQMDFWAGHTSPIHVHIAADDNGQPGDRIGGSFITTPDERFQFHRFHFPGVQQPAIITGEDGGNCWAILHYLPESPGEPSIGSDASGVDPQRNSFFTVDGGWQQFRSGQLMVRLGIGRALRSVPPAKKPAVPGTFAVTQNFPNPFNGITMIPVDLPVETRLRMGIYDVSGRLFTSRDFGLKYPGSHLIPIDGNVLGTGIYFVRVYGGEFDETIKINIAK